MVNLSSAVGLAAAGAATGSAVIGLYIGVQAYRGLRRHEERSMWYLSVGMIVLFGLAYVSALAGQGLIAFRVLPIALQDWVRLLVRVIQLVGLGLIAYSLRLASSG